MYRIAGLVVLAVLAIYVAGCVPMNAWVGPSVQPSSLGDLEQALLFHPSTDAQSWAPLPGNVKADDIWLESADGLRIHARWFPSLYNTGAVLICHGNAGNLSHGSREAIQFQQETQLSVLIFDYPGYGKSAGKPTEAGCYAAADAAWDWLTKRRNIASNNIIVVGESLGGGVATHLAEREAPKALVLVRTFTSIPDLARSSGITSSAASVVANRFDNLARIAHCKTPIFIAHGDNDKLIPIAQAHQLFEAAGQPKRFHLLKGLGHDDPLPAEFFSDLNSFLRFGLPGAQNRALGGETILGVRAAGPPGKITSFVP